MRVAHFLPPPRDWIICFRFDNRTRIAWRQSMIIQRKGISAEPSGRLSEFIGRSKDRGRTCEIAAAKQEMCGYMQGVCLVQFKAVSHCIRDKWALLIKPYCAAVL